MTIRQELLRSLSVQSPATSPSLETPVLHLAMASDYPPLPRPGALETQTQTKGLQPEINERPIPSKEDDLTTESNHGPAPKIISVGGDMIIECTDQDVGNSTVSHRWQVASEPLMHNSPYFKALLDPCKFAEGKRFMEQKQAWDGKTALAPAEVSPDESMVPTTQRVLPTIKIPVAQFTRVFGVDSLEIFLRILCLDSLAEEERSAFETDLKTKSPSLVAWLIETADAFNSPDIVRDTLRKISYSFGKGKISLLKFSESLLKLSEDRIRQIIFVAMFLEENTICQVLTHTLLVVGSRLWVNGPEAPTREGPRWRYFLNGFEEELYYRRQCVLNTLTDVQAYFLRAYGALEDPAKGDYKPRSTSLNRSLSLTQPRQFQCRGGFGNSGACDLFHLGQMIRFFAIKSNTVFVGSTLIDPDFSPSGGEDKNQQQAASSPPSDLTAIISSLKQYPDYQIDDHHIGCGVKRRLLPALMCIENFILDGHGLLGIDLRVWDEKMRRVSASWADPSSPRTHTVDVHLSRIHAIHFLPEKTSFPTPIFKAENAQFLFTAKKRNWEA